jgi:hypothetical protein
VAPSIKQAGRPQYRDALQQVLLAVLLQQVTHGAAHAHICPVEERVRLLAIEVDLVKANGLGLTLCERTVQARCDLKLAECHQMSQEEIDEIRKNLGCTREDILQDVEDFREPLIQWTKLKTLLLKRS